MNNNLYTVTNVKQSLFIDHKYRNQYLDKAYIQLLVGDQASSGSSSAIMYFDNKFSVPHEISLSAKYNMMAYYLRHVQDNGWNDVAMQSTPGVWKTPSPTGSTREVATRFQELGICNYYFGDEISNGSFRFYYLPLTGTVTGAMTSQLNQKVLRFMETNDDVFGPSFALTSGTGTLQNLSASTTAITVELYFRPVPQDKPGFLWHRWSCFNGGPIDSYTKAGLGTLSAYPFYSGAPNHGVGVYFNKLTPAWNSDVEGPYLDFFVYGALSGTDAHYLNLNTGLLNQATNTRFALNEATLKRLFDGNFHSLKACWDTSDFYSTGRIYLDGEEVPQTTVAGNGRRQSVSWSLSGSVCATPMYFMSHHDNTTAMGVQKSSKYSAFGEVKHILTFNKALSANALSFSSVSANNAVVNKLGSTSSELSSWFGFRSVSSQFEAVDLTFNYSLKALALTGTIVNDNGILYPEGSIDRVFGLIHDRRGEFINSAFDSKTGSYQRSVGKLYNNEYERSQDAYIGLMFYPKGLGLILNDGYNAEYGQSSQLFVTSPSGSFSFTDSASAWKASYVSYAGMSYVNRRTLSIVADAKHFAKSSNPTSQFRGKDGKIYTRSNKKFLTGVVWYGRDGKPLAVTKFSEPVFKNENTSLSFDIILDL